jgi:hypothetical protein
MSELVATRIREHAERLHLANLTSNLDQLVTWAEQATMGYLEFVDLLLEEEVGLREGRRFHNARKLSGLPHRGGAGCRGGRRSPASRRGPGRRRRGCGPRSPN